MRTEFHKISSFILALVVFLSSTSFTVHKHFCGTFLVDSAVFAQAESCGLHSKEETPSHSDSIEKECCNDKLITIRGQDELQVPSSSLSIEQQIVYIFSSHFFTFPTLFEESEGLTVPFKDYSPPLLVYEIQLLDQVFII